MIIQYTLDDQQYIQGGRLIITANVTNVDPGTGHVFTQLSISRNG